MNVKAAVARSHGSRLRLEGLQLDAPRDDEIVIKLIASGVSAFDLDAIDGRLAMPLPFVPGGESAGIVERVGKGVKDREPGDSVVVHFDSCGHCEPCATGHPRACIDFAALNLSGVRLDGSAPFAADGRPVNGRFFGQSSFATHLVCRASSTTKVATGAPLEILACLGGEVLLGAGVILHGFQVRPDDTIVINGAGAMGLVATMVARARGATIVVADPHESRRGRASDLGASIAVHGPEDLADLIRSLSGDGARFALETTGDPAARTACLASAGTCALVAPPTGAPLDFEDQVAEGRPLILSVDGHAPPSVLIPELIALHAKGELPIETLIDFFAFEHVNDALDALRRGDVAKPVLRFSLGGFGDLDRALVEGAAADAPDDRPTDDEPADENPTEKVGTDSLVRS